MIESSVAAAEDMKNHIYKNTLVEKAELSQEKRHWMELRLKMGEVLLEEEKRLQSERRDMESKFAHQLLSTESKEKKVQLREIQLKTEMETINQDQSSLEVFKADILEIKRHLEKQKRDFAMDKSSFNTERELFDNEKQQLYCTLKEVADARDMVSKERKRLSQWSESNREKEQELRQIQIDIENERFELNELKKELSTMPFQYTRRYKSSNADNLTKRRVALNRIEKRSQSIQQKLNS